MIILRIISPGQEERHGAESGVVQIDAGVCVDVAGERGLIFRLLSFCQRSQKRNHHLGSKTGERTVRVLKGRDRRWETAK